MTVTALPTKRHPDRPFDPPPEFAEIRDRDPLVRFVYPDGHRGWLATGHAEVRTILGDRRFSSRYELAHLPLPGGPAELPPASVGDLTGIDPPEHARLRRPLIGWFTVRRMRQLADRIGQIAAEHLDAMQRSGSPADLVPAFAEPIPTLTICELLGVPYADRDTFRAHVHTVMSQSAPMEAKGAALAALHEYQLELVRAKRAHPTDDIIGALTTGDADLTDDELAGLGSILLGAGLDTTANMIALGTFALLVHPEQLAALRAHPEIVDTAIEELLRFLSVADVGLRSALEDVEVSGRLIRAGESVTLAIGAANRDPRKFPDPDRLDLRRGAAGHLALGHGLHQCLGQQLARVEMRAAFPALLSRLPGLRLDVAPGDVPMRTDANIHGVHALPVAW
jgi:cytochrome P450